VAASRPTLTTPQSDRPAGAPRARRSEDDAADILESKKIFARRAREQVPLVRSICKALTNTKDGNLGENFFLDLLRRGFSEEEAHKQLRIAVDWGRNGELFDLDANTGQLALDHAVDAGAA
jgi:NitT/TauT family transport system ATP-binding protein